MLSSFPVQSLSLAVANVPCIPSICFVALYYAKLHALIQVPTNTGNSRRQYSTPYKDTQYMESQWYGRQRYGIGHDVATLEEIVNMLTAYA